MLAAMAVCSGAAAAVPRAEYPRPQFVRADWVNLNGEWSYSMDPVMTGWERGLMSSRGFADKIIVPFAPESKLSGVEHKEFIPCIWYQREISVPEAWAGKDILLNFGAVYYESEVYIDGKFVARHFGGSDSFSVDITDFVKAGGMHSLVVSAKSDLRSREQSAGKQSLRHGPFECMYTRTTGIWQTVWMEAVAPCGLSRVKCTTDIDRNEVSFEVSLRRNRSGNTLTVNVMDGGKTIASQTAPVASGSVVTLPVKKAKLWSPESPFLYDVEFLLKDADGNTLDKVTSYFGMRKIHTEGNRIYLNNEPYYQRLVLDQGFYPDGIWTAPSDDALKKDIELSMAAGFNGARLHQKVFEERFYYWADKLGYLTWGEASSWGMDCNAPTNEEFWPDRVQYPRLMQDLYKVTKMIDPTRPFHGASGGTHIATDIWTVHNYEQDPAKLKEQLYNGGKLMQAPKWEIQLMPKNIGYNGLKYTDQYVFPEYKKDMPYLIDEFGGIKWNPSQQMERAQNVSWGYGEPPRSLEEFYSRLEGLVDTVLSLSGDIWGYCYTQLTDVEQEQNGIYYYDRTPKFDMKRIHAIFSKTPETEAE